MVSSQHISIPFSKISTKTKNFSSIFDSDMKHFQTLTRDVLKFQTSDMGPLPGRAS